MTFVFLDVLGKIKKWITYQSLFWGVGVGELHWSVKFKRLGTPGMADTCVLANVELFRTSEVSAIELLFRKD